MVKRWHEDQKDASSHTASLIKLTHGVDTAFHSLSGVGYKEEVRQMGALHIAIQLNYTPFKLVIIDYYYIV